MKVNVTCLDCEITVEEVDGKCIVTAHQGGEEVESFAVDCNETEADSDELDEVDMEDVEGSEEDESIDESIKTFDVFFVTEGSDEEESDEDHDEDHGEEDEDED